MFVNNHCQLQISIEDENCQLNEGYFDETGQLVTTSDRLTILKHSSVKPLAFTEQGVACIHKLFSQNKPSGLLLKSRVPLKDIGLFDVKSRNKEMNYTHWIKNSLVHYMFFCKTL